jgi:hypothetical protein
MDEAEAVQLLLNAVQLDAASEVLWAAARDIVAELGCLALTIDQTSAYIARGECRINDFIETLKRYHAEFFKSMPTRGRRRMSAQFTEHGSCRITRSGARRAMVWKGRVRMPRSPATPLSS